MLVKVNANFIHLKNILTFFYYGETWHNCIKYRANDYLKLPK